MIAHRRPTRITAICETTATDDGTVGRITREARLYAVRELLRRAGVPVEVFLGWSVTFEPEWTVVWIESGTPKRLRFRTARFRNGKDICDSSFGVGRAGWMHSPHSTIINVIPDFIVPFMPADWQDGTPLFHEVDSDCIECDLDLPLSALLTLSRVEENQNSTRDAHGRFAASTSLAYQRGYLNRPIVDEYGLAIEQALCRLLPNWRPATRRLRVKLSHDVDLVGIPYSLRTAIGHTLSRRTPSATVRDLVATLTAGNPTYLALVMRIAELSLERGFDSAFYWKASPPGAYDSGYQPGHPKIRQVIAWLTEHGIENGVHPGYETFRDRSRLMSEVRLLREIVGGDMIGGRQHFLRWCPETWTDWEACGLAYDSTVGFADAIGFRAGTCIPYRPWIVPMNRQADLLEIPLIVMDCTPIVYMGMSPSESLAAILTCVQVCRAVGGVFTLLWHNTTMMDPVYGDLYEQLLGHLEGAEKLDWRSSLRDRA